MLREPTEVLTAASAVPARSPGGDGAAGATPVERALATVLADVVGRPVTPASHFFDELGADSMLMAQFCARVRKRGDLPAISIKDVYQHPTIHALVTAVAPPVATNPVETTLTAVLAEVVGRPVTAESHFFEELGADSMVMATFCARVRKRGDLPAISIKDVYAHPTVRGLATALATDVPAPAAPAQTDALAPPVAHRATSGQYVITGALQLLIFIGYSLLSGAVFVWCFDWISAGGSLVDDYRRSVEAAGAAFVFAVTLPILVKWVLIGRWKPQQIPLWSLGYLRFWLVRTLVMANPLVLFAGSPLYNVYLRALGAKVGRGAVVFTRHAPVCTDLISIGEGAVIRKDSYLNGYRAHSGWIQTGPVTIGRNAFIGDRAVLDIGSSVGDGSQLGHASALHAGQAVPAGERWHGSPAQPTTSDYQRIDATSCPTWRRVGYGIAQLLAALLVYLPVAFGGVATVVGTVPQLAALLEPGPAALESAAFYEFALVLSLVVFFGGLVLRFLFLTTVAGVLGRALQPDRVYPLYGFRYSVHRTVLHFSNSRFFPWLTGDSSYVVGYVRSLGYRLGRPVVQTGSNFGNEVKQEAPTLTSVGSGTVVASGISVLNATYSSTSFRMSRTSLGPNNFLGNDIIYPPEGRTGENCLLATKVLVPIDGDVREGVGLLGAPAFEIPRTVERDSKFIRMAHDEDFPRRLAAKNRYNLRTVGLALTVRWLYFFIMTVVVTTGLDFLDELGAWAFTLASLAILLFSVVYFCGLEFVATRFLDVRPMHCSIYVKDFWRRERFFKLCARMGVHRLAAGTPFASLLWRIVGVRLGKRLFDDGHMMAEKTLVTIGDDVTLNAGSYIQVHTQEDYAFKSDATTVGSGCTFGIGAMAHYAVTMGDDVVLAPDSFLMKGEEVPSGARWGGNPARELQAGDLRLPAVQSVQLTRDHHDTGDAMQIPAQRIVADAEPEGTTAPRPNGRHVARGRHREPTR